MAAASAAGKVVVYFGWKGPTTWHGGWQNGGIDVGSIDLVFKDAITRVSVRLPEDMDPTATSRLSFTCRKSPGRETHPNALSLTIDQIRQLTLNAAFLEKSPVSNWTMMDERGNITRDERIRRSDRKVSLNIPDNLEAGKTYLIEVSSKELSLSARLVEEPSKTAHSPEDQTCDRDQLELFQLLGGILLPLMGCKMAEFSIRIMHTSSAPNFIAKSNINSQTIGTDFIKKEIGKIEKQTLKELAEKLRQAKVVHQSKSLKDRVSIEKEIIKACFDAMEPNSLKAIMRSNLESVVRSEITPDVRELIESISARFQEICMNQISG